MSPAETNPVDNKKVPSRHFGAILDWDEWQLMKDKLEADCTDFIIAPTTRFAGEVGEQATMFFAPHQVMHLSSNHSVINQ